jgi:hypothetical protein
VSATPAPRAFPPIVGGIATRKDAERLLEEIDKAQAQLDTLRKHAESILATFTAWDN